MNRIDWNTGGRVHRGLELLAIIAPLVAALVIFARTARGAEPPKPRAPETLHASWCSGNACNAFCEAPAKGAPRVACQIGSRGVVKRSQLDKFAAASEPTDLVDAAISVRAVLALTPPSPCTDQGPDACGVSFVIDKDLPHKLRAGVIPGLVKAVQLARARKDAKGAPAGYSVHIGYSYRSLFCQTQLTCNHLGESPPCDGVTLSCPGPNIHSDGVAIDVFLKQNGKQVTWAGSSMDCKVAAQQVLNNKHLRALHEIMYAAGWWNYCKEPWHFEYTENPYSGKLRVNRIEDLGK